MASRAPVSAATHSLWYFVALATLGRARTHYRVSPDPQVKGHGPSSSLVSAGYHRTSMLAGLLAQASAGEMKCVQASGWEDRQKVRAEVLVAHVAIKML